MSAVRIRIKIDLNLNLREDWKASIDSDLGGHSISSRQVAASHDQRHLLRLRKGETFNPMTSCSAYN